MSALFADLSLERPEFSLRGTFRVEGITLLTGENGAGKTTLMRGMLGLVPEMKGTLRWNEEVLVDSERGLDTDVEDRRFGYLPQTSALFPHLTIEENLRFAQECARPTIPKGERKDLIDWALHSLRLGELAKRQASRLSGGERQRAALARALANRPRALFLDEPFSAQDVDFRPVLTDFLGTFVTQRGIPTLLIHHGDGLDGLPLGRTLVLERGVVRSAD